MTPAKLLKQRIEAQDVVTGVLATFHIWPGMVELAKRAGLDYIIVDREHGAHSDELTAEICAIGRMIDFAIFIRPIDVQYSTIRRSIDLGPCGLLVPTVESAQQLDQVRSAIYMPPRGSRRPGGAGNYWVPSYDYDTWRSEIEDDFIVLPQIERKVGLDHVDEIADHEITTAIAIGPYDLSADLGVCGDMECDKLIAAETRIRTAGSDAGKSMWVIGDGKRLRQRGHHFICIGEPTAILQGCLSTTAAECRETSGR